MLHLGKAKALFSITRSRNTKSDWGRVREKVSTFPIPEPCSIRSAVTIQDHGKCRDFLVILPDSQKCPVLLMGLFKIYNCLDLPSLINNNYKVNIFS